MDVLDNLAGIASGQKPVRFEVELNDEDLMRITVGITISLSVAIAVGVILAKKLN